MNQIAQIEAFVKELNKVKADSYLLNAANVSIVKLKEGTTLEKIERIVLNNYEQLEETGWELKDSHKVLAYWLKLGHILGIDRFEEKINHFRTDLSTVEKIAQLNELKKTKRVHEMTSAPIFYNALKKLMDESIDHVFTQLKHSNRIDEMLQVFDKNLNQFDDLATADHSFGDTEDSESIGEFYMKIMDIVGFTYSRGLLSSRL